MDVNGAPPSGGSTFKNTISKEDFAALLAQSKPGDTPSSNSSHASALNAESWLKDSSADSGRFIALPLSMLSLRKSEAKLSLSELLVLAYIHGFQRRDPLKGCHSNAKTIAEALGISPSALSKRLQKLKNFALIKKEGSMRLGGRSSAASSSSMPGLFTSGLHAELSAGSPFGRFAIPISLLSTRFFSATSFRSSRQRNQSRFEYRPRMPPISSPSAKANFVSPSKSSQA